MASALHFADSATGGLVLCGGQSLRMGRAKAWLPFGPELMLQRIVKAVREIVEPVVVIAADDQALPVLPPNVNVVHDTVAGHGPLQGLAEGLTFLRGRVEAAFVTSCDVPFLRPELVRRLVGLLADHEIVMPEVDGVRHPLCTIYRLSILPRVHGLLARGQFRIGSLVEVCATRLVGPAELETADPGLRSLWNLNTRDDYDKALRQLASAECC